MNSGIMFNADWVVMSKIFNTLTPVEELEDFFNYGTTEQLVIKVCCCCFLNNYIQILAKLLDDL